MAENPYDETTRAAHPTNGDDATVYYRVDSDHRLASRRGTRGKATGATDAQRVASATGRAEEGRNAPRVVLSPHAGADQRVERWLRHERSRWERGEEVRYPRASLTPFERVLATWLSENSLCRAELQKLSQLLIVDTPPEAQRALFISLARDIDIPRILLGASMTSVADRDVVLVDGDAQRRTLTVLLQQQAHPGLQEVLRGSLRPEDSVRALATERTWLLPAGLVGPAGASVSAPRAVARWRPEAALWIDGGLWPTSDLPPLLSLADRVLAVVRVNETQWVDFSHLRRVLTQHGRRLDGCLVAGDFE